jgi:hypothetical protein
VLADRSVSEVGQLISGIVDDQKLEIDMARHDLDGAEVGQHEQLDEQAGLSVEDRLQLSRRYLRQRAQLGHHAIWFVYENARLGAYWPKQVGPVAFFCGPGLLSAIQNSEHTTSGYRRSYSNRMQKEESTLMSSGRSLTSCVGG